MYKYLLNVSAARPKYVITDELADILKTCCEEANKKKNSEKKGYKFTYLERIDDYSVKIQLESRTSVIATRAISSITRVLLTKIDAEDLIYNRNILKATIDTQSQEDYENMDDTEVGQVVLELLYGQASLGKKDRALAQIAADQIREICKQYKKDTSGPRNAIAQED